MHIFLISAARIANSSTNIPVAGGGFPMFLAIHRYDEVVRSMDSTEKSRITDAALRFLPVARLRKLG